MLELTIEVARYRFLFALFSASAMGLPQLPSGTNEDYVNVNTRIRI